MSSSSLPPSFHSLPTPRHLITSLINSLSPSSSTAAALADPTSSNPLKALSTQHRALLTTLHVLLPSILLPALDLLDRGLVSRVLCVNEGRGVDRGLDQGQGRAPGLAQAGGQVEGEVERDAVSAGESGVVGEGGRNVTYIVRSAQEAQHHYRRSHHASASASSISTGTTTTTAAGGQSYVVHVQAWNCSCAAFAFSALPSSTARDYTSAGDNDWEEYDEDDEEMTRAGSGGRGGAEWEFGGLSSNGKVEGETQGGGGGGGVPCCKHLLACVLAERWGGVVGVYVKERVVSREEMAGLVAEL